MQDNQLFSGTVLENICLGDPNPSLQKAIQAAKDAQAHEFVTVLSEGYSTKVGEGGVQLSGGQRQRICVARAFYSDPPILILDEATSALDAATERKLMEFIKDRSKRRTTILIAHRLNTVTHADYIYVFEKGKITEKGSHEQLLARQGKYFNFFRRQFVA